MGRKAIKVLRLCVLGTLIAFLSGCDFPEATFHQAESSRAPKWCKPVGSNADNTDESRISYYIGKGGRHAIITCIRGWSPFRRSKIRVDMVGAGPISFSDSKQLSRPTYEILHAGGITEVVEHPNFNDEFVLVDDAAVIAKVLSHADKRPAP